MHPRGSRVASGKVAGKKAAHDLKNLFAIIGYNAELALRSGLEESSVAYECLSQILSACACGRGLAGRAEALRGTQKPGSSVAARARPSGDGSQGDGAPAPRRSGRILFVDDDDAIAHAGSRLLEHLGCRVLTAVSGWEAIELVREEPEGFDLIISDYAMPGLNGLGLARGVREISPTVPIVLCTGWTHELTAEELGGARIQAVIQKPLHSSELKKVIGFYLN